MTKSTLTLTESGLLALLLEHQRRKVIQLARRRAHRERLCAAFWDTVNRPFRAFAARRRADGSTEPSVETLPRQV